MITIQRKDLIKLLQYSIVDENWTEVADIAMTLLELDASVKVTDQITDSVT